MNNALRVVQHFKGGLTFRDVARLPRSVYEQALDMTINDNKKPGIDLD